MIKLIKTYAVLLLCILCPTIFTGCGGREIDDMSYVVAIGVDLNESTGYDFTFAIGNPGSINGGGGEESGGGDGNALVIETAQSENIFTAGEEVSSKIGQTVNFSHAELMVFSKEVAVNSVERFAESILRNLSQRPKLVPITTDGTAKEYICSIHSQFEGNPEKYLKKVFENTSSLAIDNKEFLSRTKNPSGGVAVFNSIKTESGIAVNAMSAFYQGKLVGSFDDITAYKFLSGTAGRISWNAVEGGTLLLTQRRKPRIKVECNDVPYIEINIELDSTVESIPSGVDREQLRYVVEGELEDRVYELLKYISTQLQTDVTGFFKDARRNFLTEQSWQNYNWTEKFKNTIFSINVEILPEKTGLIRGEI